MNLGLKNKNAVVLASTKGLGKAIAKTLYTEGCNVAICSRSVSSVQNTIKEFEHLNSESRVIGKAVDVSNPDEIDSFFDFVESEFDSVDILVTNAGGPPSGKFDDFSDKEWLNAFEQNLMSVVRSIRRAVPSMKIKKQGKIIAITSISVKSPVENLILSNTIRAGVTGLIKSLSNELAEYNITVNSVCPGYILTDRVQQLSKNESERTGNNEKDIIKMWEQKIPMKRMGTPDEFASLVVYMCSNKAGYITGTTFWMDGGRYQGLM
ncbi:MAG: SDR family oxidoreductase [Chlorobi bacterium]|nr:SDR family oxidoreductase [Chlorobiota bacterium]